MSGKLIVTADDLGLDAAMNAGVFIAHREGIVTTSSVVAVGKAFDAAVAALPDYPALSIGVHLTLVEEPSVAPAESVPSLLGANGRFFENFRVFTVRFGLGLISRDQIERELRAQIEKVLAAGIKPSHLNGHQHLHVLPAIFEIVARLAAEYRIDYLRIPNDDAQGVSAGRRASIAVLNWCGRRARARRGDAKTTGSTLGIGMAGHFTTDVLLQLIAAWDGSDSAELVCHPGTGSSSEQYNWGYGWEEETRALCDPRVKSALQSRKIELCTPETL